MTTTDQSTLPLQGVRVVDWTIGQTGPSATQLLADMGAQVIKVESPAGGDMSRGTTKMDGTGVVLPHGLPYNFENHNRNKLSISIDLTKEEGKQIVYSLVARSDVFVQNFRVGVAQRMGLGYEMLRKHNQSLVYANCSGYGPRGPQARRSALDPAIHAASGMMLGIGEANMPPIHLTGAMADQTTAIMLAYGIMVALFCRERTGIGQELDVSMLGTMIWVQTNNILTTILNGKPRPKQLRAQPPNPLWNHYRCKDGRWILLAHSQSDRFWPPLCRAMGLQDLTDDHRFKDIGAREKNSAELVSILDGVFATRTRDEWEDILASEDLIFSPIRDYLEVSNDPQVLENNYIVEFDHPAVGKLKEIGTPVQFRRTPASIREPAPRLGQHTEQVLVDILGISWQEIEGLRNRNVIL